MLCHLQVEVGLFNVARPVFDTDYFARKATSAVKGQELTDSPVQYRRLNSRALSSRRHLSLETATDTTTRNGTFFMEIP